eukprot:14503440-Alexandrium_andersonii.AAC.1
MMIQCPSHYALVRDAGDRPCDDACPCSKRKGTFGAGPSYRRRGESIVPSALCHLMNPCTERNADVASEGMYWSDRSGG